MNLPKWNQQEGTLSLQALERHRADENKLGQTQTSRAGWGCSSVVELLPLHPVFLIGPKKRIANPSQTEHEKTNSIAFSG